MTTITQETPVSIDSLGQILGTPTWRADGLLLYCDDAVRLLERLPENSINLTVTSPPYNIGKPYEQCLPIDEYVEWCTKWARLVHQATTTKGAFWLNLGYVSLARKAKAVPIPYLLWGKMPFFFVQEIVWNYGAGVASRYSFSPRNEKFLWYVKDEHSYVFNLDDIRDPEVKYPNQRKNGRLRVNPLGKNPSDVWQIPKVTTGEDMTGQRASPERTAHPAQFPEAVIERIIRASSNPGDIVLDPFAGSGTVLAVAKRLKRQAIGFEIRTDYVEIARRRISRQIETGFQRSLL